MAKAKWTTDVRQITTGTDADGTFRASFPLLDNGVKAATLVVTVTADRALRFEVRNEPGAAGLAGFQAWSTQ